MMQKEHIIEKLKQIKELVGDNTVYITGHYVTDVDSYVSMILTSKLLNLFNIKNKTILSYKYDEVDDVTRKVIERLELEKIEEYKPNKDSYIFLVDHNSKYESLNYISDSNIVGIIDHHEDEGTKANLKIVKKSGSTTKILYELFNSLGVNLQKKELKWILYALFVDTCALMNSKTGQKDKDFSSKLINELNLNINTIQEETVFTTDLSKSLKELMYNGKKTYNIDDYSISSSYIEINGINDDLKKTLYKIRELIKKEDCDLFIFMVNDFKLGKTFVYTEGALKKYVKDKEYSFIASRGCTVIPEIRNIVKNI